MQNSNSLTLCNKNIQNYYQFPINDAPCYNHSITLDARCKVIVKIQIQQVALLNANLLRLGRSLLGNDNGQYPIVQTSANGILINARRRVSTEERRGIWVTKPQDVWYVLRGCGVSL